MFAATFAATCSVVALGRGTLLALPSTVPARHLPSRCQAAAAWPGESDGQGTYAPPPVRPTGRWQRIGACDVLLPEFGGECGAIVHFVGGALVGGAPQNTYGAFLETLADFGVCVVANPSGGTPTPNHGPRPRPRPHLAPPSLHPSPHPHLDPRPHHHPHTLLQG